MSELSIAYEVSGKTQTSQADFPDFTKVRSLRAGTHPASRVNDPLGNALLRLHGQRHVIELMESAVSTRENAEVSATATLADESSETHPVEQAPEILPITSLHSESAKSTGGLERRRFPRRQSECAVAVIDRQRAAGLTPQQVDWLLQASREVGRLIDISQAGLCLLTSGDLKVGSEVLLRISNYHLNRHVDNTATVIRAQATGHGQVTVHCVVQREFTLDQLQDLGRAPL